MNRAYYEQLYKLQDDVLHLVFKEPYGFYLTGGTALSRFYFNHRYSDDLDFFHSDIAVFPNVFRLVFQTLRGQWPQLSLQIDERDFKRLWIHFNEGELKIDFVADRVPRIGIPIVKGSVLVDTVRNILSNKICAILGRDEEKDIADLVWISINREFYWPEILAEAQKKENFKKEEFLYRLSTFPVELLRNIHFCKPIQLSYVDEALKTIRQDIQAESVNSLAKEPLSLPLE